MVYFYHLFNSKEMKVKYETTCGHSLNLEELFSSLKQGFVKFKWMVKIDSENAVALINPFTDNV